MNIRWFFPALVLLLVTGCANQQHSQYANNSGVIVDTQGIDLQQYHADMADCRQYANQVPTGERTAKSTAGGAVVGGVLGAVVGNSNTAAKGAGVGAVTGALKGSSSGSAEKERVVKNCLIGRGYRVLN